ncbi:MAG: alkaline phosphatase family protein [Candidatus Methanoperedens sp.]|nr:alkaline phosphatase family protein [Candidatus Methanoperedens sp.]MCZ7371824.1 alkaline phosphatase family protein [Candidatus Methanoperedens sp.]
MVIGLDGATLDLIRPWAREGKLPMFQKLISESCCGNLESSRPPITIPAWNCLATGKNPGRIGCFSFIQKSSGSYDFRVYSKTVDKEEDIWDILSDNGSKVFILNAPNILSAYRINGHMVAGSLCTNEDRLTYPKELGEELRNLNYEMDMTDPDIFGSLNDKEFSRRHKEITEKHCKVLFKFLDKPWDFGFFVFTELDRVQHQFWDKKDILLSHYQNIDNKLRQIINKIEEGGEKPNIFIVSDHGFGPNKKAFLVNEFLINRGLLELKRTPILDIIRNLVSILRKPIILKMITPLLTISFIRPLYRNITRQTGRTPIRWERTQAFSYATWGTIYINLAGREPQGIVKEEDYEKLRDEIIDGLEKISVKAYRREEVYSGKYLNLAPDIILDTDDNINSITSKVGYGSEFVEWHGGSHRLNGTFIVRGPDIKENFEINAKITDVAPTILHMLSMPVPKDMDGRILKEIFKVDSPIMEREIKYIDSDNREMIRKRIAALKRLDKI